ncbi:unnamed protein product [Arctogadus glacialis]
MAPIPIRDHDGNKCLHFVMFFFYPLDMSLFQINLNPSSLRSTIPPFASPELNPIAHTHSCLPSLSPLSVCTPTPSTPHPHLCLVKRTTTTGPDPHPKYRYAGYPGMFPEASHCNTNILPSSCGRSIKSFMPQ